MATKSIGTLRAQLILDTENFLNGFAKAQGATKSFASSFVGGIGSKLFASVAGIVTAGTAMHSLAGGMEQVDRQAKLADRLGISVGEVQKLALAADLAGTDVELLARSMLKMGKNIGSGGQSLDKRLFQVADSLAKIKDAGERGKRAEEIFGKGGQETLNLLIQGGKGIRDSANAIDRFGLALSRVDAAKVEAANDSWTEMKTVLGGIRNQIAVEISPTITNFIQQWLDGVEMLIKRHEALRDVISGSEGGNGILDYFLAGINAVTGVEGGGRTFIDAFNNTLAGLRESRSDRARNAAYSGGLGGAALLGRSALGGATGNAFGLSGALEKGSVAAASAITNSGGVVDKIEEHTKRAALALERAEKERARTKTDSITFKPSRFGGGGL